MFPELIIHFVCSLALVQLSSLYVDRLSVFLRKHSHSVFLRLLAGAGRTSVKVGDVCR